MAMPTIFTSKGGEAIASYSYLDIAEGTGITNYYGYAVDTGTGTKNYKLTTSTSIYSASGGANDGQYGKTRWSLVAGASGSVEANFDLLFNRPQRLKGNVLLNIQTSISTVNPGSTVYLKIKLYKYDGSTETAISSQVTTETITSGVAGALNGNPFFSVQVPLSALTNFKKGETFRIEVIIYYSLAANSDWVDLFHSPSDSISGYVTSKFIAAVPFVLDL